MHFLIQLLVEHHSGIVSASIASTLIVSVTPIPPLQDRCRHRRGHRRRTIGPIACEGQTLDLNSEIVVVAARGSASTSGHTFSTRGTRKTMTVSGRPIGKVGREVDRRGIGHRLALVCCVADDL